MLRGDHDLNEVKAKQALGLGSEVTFASEEQIKSAEKEKIAREREQRERVQEIIKEEEKQKIIEEEKEIALKQKIEEEERIKNENYRIREWEEKFDQDQKMKEEALIQKFYKDQSSDPKNQEISKNSNLDNVTSDSEENKNN